MKRILLLIALFTIVFVNAQSVLVKDIETGSLSSMPTYTENRVDYNGKLVFSALDNSTNNYNVWISDGSESGTELLKAHNANSNPGNYPQYFTYLNNANKVFYKAPIVTSSSNRLWSTDGITANTLYAGSSLIPKYITKFNNNVYFSGYVDAQRGIELIYFNNNTNTTSVIDLNTNSSNSFPTEFKVIGNSIYFSAIGNNSEGREAFISDGTAAGTSRIKDINTNSSDSSNPKNFTSFNNKVYFSADDGINGRELWVTDGTAANTMMVSDLNPGTNPSLDPAEPTIFTVYKDELYFTAFTPATGNELFKVNASGNIVNAADINPGGSGHSNPKDFFVFDGKLYFSADDGTNGVELWVLNNTGSSTAKSSAKQSITVTMLKDINVGGGSSKPNQFIAFEDKLYFNANDGINDKELWVTDGTSVGTVMVQNINPSGDSNPRDFIVSNNLLYFSANDGTHGDELWKFSNNPIVASLDPADNSTDVAIDNKLKITFNKDVQKNNGNITIYDASDDSVVEIINITSSSISITGNQVTIEPSADFAMGKQLYVQIDNGAIRDLNNILFSGISDKTTWNFETINKQNQTITFNVLPNKTFGDADFSLSATASSNLAVAYTSSDANVATINGNTVTIKGSGSTTITASQSGDTNFNSASNITQVLTVDKANQVTTFTALSNKTFGDVDFQLTANASSNLPISYVSSNTNVATINGNIVNIIGAGVTTITASQPGNANYNAASNITQSFIVNKANQSITFILNFPNEKFYNDANQILNATSTSGLLISYTSSNSNVLGINGNVASFVGVGNGITITASQAGNNNYNAASIVAQTVDVKQAGQTVIFNPPTNLFYGDPNFNLIATSESGVPSTFFSFNSNIISISGNQATITGSGTVNIQATNDGNSFYVPAIATKSITINKADQTITFNSIADVDVNDPNFNLSATSNSGLPLTYISSNPTVASVSGNIVSINAIGTTTFTASQAGNNNYNVAADVMQSLTVSSTASINDLKKLGIEISPNPTKSILNITSTSKILNIEIFNVLGQKVLKSKSLNIKKIDVSNQ